MFLSLFSFYCSFTGLHKNIADIYLIIINYNPTIYLYIPLGI